MNTLPPLSRLSRHVTGIVIAVVACFLSLFPAALLSGGVGSLVFLAAGAGWMVGGLAVDREYPESGPVLFLGGATSAWMVLVGVNSTRSALSGLFEFQLACLGGALAAWFMLRANKRRRLTTVSLALVIAVVLPVLVLQFRPPGSCVEIVNAAGNSEWVYVADNGQGYGHQEISHVWRSGSSTVDSEGALEIVEGPEWTYGRPYELRLIVDPEQVETAYEALRQTELKFVEAKVESGRIPAFMTKGSWLRGDYRRGSVWKAAFVED